MSTPRRKRLNRKGRLQAAKKWIPTYEGKNLVRGYKKWFGVDFICAIKELEMLGHEINEKYKKQILKQEEAKRKAAKERKRSKKEELIDDPSWQNAKFYFIAGYTSNGVPYGITWEEYEEKYSETNQDDTSDDSQDNLNNDFFDDVPF
ncbi:hypothetical protein [Selenihalanaerobacter shriftii]|uniref:hypothetical protein n=1 Tax=Selenihalanaerobacter shriftii TaxID=142842 RepID=UPI000999B974|nr:hypothetical protein [Selenihalanaerobacter shriftii]